MTPDPREPGPSAPPPGPDSDSSANADEDGQRESGDGEEVYVCDLCGSEMLNRHCKLVCPACGYQRDCSDP